jgi:uncharacterized protein involved in exopolysaccharide biosynthesis
MTDEIKKSEPVNIATESEDEIDLLELARVIWKGKKLIIGIVVFFTVAVLIASLFMTNIYTAKAVIKPVSPEKGSARLSSLAAQFGGLASMAGIAMPGAASSTELVSLLKSNVLKKQVIEKYNLLPVLFPQKWDAEKKVWKKQESGGFSLNPMVLLSNLVPKNESAPKKDPAIPDTWDGIRALDKIVNVNYNLKEDIITITVNFRDPEMAAAIGNHYLIALNEHISSEAKRMAVVNKEYLEKQLKETNDSLVQQKIYTLIAEKIETMMMAEVKEGFAFKTLDPPMAPDQKSKPKRAQMVVVAFIASLFLSIFIVFFREYVKKIRAKSAGGPNVS